MSSSSNYRIRSTYTDAIFSLFLLYALPYKNTPKIANIQYFGTNTAARLSFATDEGEPVAASVVVIVVTCPATVTPLTVVPGIVTGTVIIEIEVAAIVDPDTKVGNRIVSSTNEKVVSGSTVVPSLVVPGNVVVYVRITSLPNELAGTADPIPVPVNWLGIGSVAVSGLSLSSG